MNYPRLLARALGLLLFCCGGQAIAAQCEVFGYPSPEAVDTTQFTFQNDTRFEATVFWSDLNGNLKWTGTVHPFLSETFRTYIGHIWYVELKGPGSSCIGPIIPTEFPSCEAIARYKDGEFQAEAEGCTVNEAPMGSGELPEYQTLLPSD